MLNVLDPFFLLHGVDRIQNLVDFIPERGVRNKCICLALWLGEWFRDVEMEGIGGDTISATRAQIPGVILWLSSESMALAS